MKKIGLRFIIVLIIMGLSYGVYFFVATKSQQKPAQTIGIESLSQGIYPIGNFSNGWVEKIQSASEFYEKNSYDYIVVQAKKAIPTGVYTRKTWIGPYDGSSRVRKRKNPIPQVTTKPFGDIEYMHQYYLIELMDGSYINAILESQYVKKINDTKDFTLPIGKQIGITKQAKSLLQKQNIQYDVQFSPVLYMIDDQWYIENQSGINFTALIWGAGAFVVLVVIAGFTLGNVFED